MYNISPTVLSILKRYLGFSNESLIGHCHEESYLFSRRRKLATATEKPIIIRFKLGFVFVFYGEFGIRLSEFPLYL